MTCNIEYISNTSCLKILRSYKYYSYFIQSNLRLLNMFRHQTLVPRSLFDAIHYILTLQCSTSFVVSKHNLLTGKAWIPLHIGHMLGRCTQLCCSIFGKCCALLIMLDNLLVPRRGRRGSSFWHRLPAGRWNQSWSELTKVHGLVTSQHSRNHRNYPVSWVEYWLCLWNLGMTLGNGRKPSNPF